MENMCYNRHIDEINEKEIFYEDRQTFRFVKRRDYRFWDMRTFDVCAVVSIHRVVDGGK